MISVQNFIAEVDMRTAPKQIREEIYVAAGRTKVNVVKYRIEFY